jgi:hypothetical protein
MTTNQVNVVYIVSELARQVRHGTLQLLQVPDKSWLTWSPAGTSNHILWHAGHAVWLQDALTIRPLTGGSELPSGWAKTFGQNSLPKLTANWPAEDEVQRRLESQLQRVLALLVEYEDTITRNANADSRPGGWPLLAGIIHGWHDEARHQGEMYLLHKLFHGRLAK